MFVPLRTRVGANTGTPSLIGHLRSGESTSVNGKRRPVASDTWIVSGVDQRVADAVSDHFGAPVEPWDDPKTMDKWRVRTGLPTVPVRLGYLDPDRLAQYELFGGKGLVKRCDATRDGTRTCWTVLRDGPHTAEVSGPCECVAAIETGRQGDECRPTLRLPVFLDIRVCRLQPSSGSCRIPKLRAWRSRGRSRVRNKRSARTCSGTAWN
jgi:hypothetical protein